MRPAIYTWTDHDIVNEEDRWGKFVAYWEQHERAAIRRFKFCNFIHDKLDNLGEDLKGASFDVGYDSEDEFKTEVFYIHKSKNAYISFFPGDQRIDANGVSLLWCKVCFACVSEEDEKLILGIIEKYSVPYEPQHEYIVPGYVSLLSRNAMGALYFRQVTKPVFHPLVRDNYDDVVLQQFDRAVSQLVSKNPQGRICILQGPPGTGKTYMVRGILQHMQNVQVILISPEFINALNDPGIVELFLDEADKGRPIVVLLEDADHCLAPRDGDNMASISKILNLGDGILGQSLDVRLICTTNVKLNTFDPAIVRPGRLLELINIETLPYEKAKMRYHEIGGTIPLVEDRYTIAELYELAKRVF